jgi:TRAP-type C4-dicarboxylate transport system permease small subunit
VNSGQARLSYWISRFSSGVLSLEKKLLTGLTALLVLLILLNIVTRSAGVALFWVDELAVFTMIWMALMGASAMVRMRYGVAVTLVTDLLPPALRKIIARLVDAIIVVLAAALLVLSWLWYDPVALIRSGFDLDLFAQNTFKFIYFEPTNTVGISKFWIWLAVPLMSVNMTLHAIANLLEGPPVEPGPDGDGERALTEL